MSLTPRQEREKKYYDQYAQLSSRENIDFAPVHSVQKNIERRPWNSYWELFSKAYSYFKKDAKLLDLGCGPGENSLLFSEIGYEVLGIDISSENINKSNKLFEKHKREGKFLESSAEVMPFEDESFDIICGVDILHHIEIKESIKECKRILKPGGVALFREPIEVPLLDGFRNTSLMLKIFPKDMSFDKHITHDEKKLLQSDLELIESSFGNISIDHYLLFARFDKFYRSGSNPKPSLLEKFDYYLFKFMPVLKKFAGGIIITLKK